MESDLGVLGPAVSLPRERPAVSSRLATAFVCGLFVLSGACGLAYEVLWTRYLSLFLGNTVLLHMAVLGTFMGGLALGSFILGKRAGRWGHPLKLYGWLELGVAGYAVLFPTLAGAAEAAVLAAAGPLPSGTAGLLAVKILTGALLLVVPTILMGGTFPALTGYLQRSSTTGGIAGVSWLYFANCAGAVIGVLVAGFGLIPGLGLAATSMAVAIFNALIGAGAILASGYLTVSDPPQAAAVSPTAKGDPKRSAILAGICLSGAAAFVYELVWTRMFAVTLGSSTYSFTLMLAAFITGLALGSIAAGAAPLRRRPLAAFILAEALIALAVAASIPLYPRLPYWFWQWKWILRPVAESIVLFHLFQYGLAFLVMAVPTFLFGLTFPLAIRAASEQGDREISGEAASVYGWNTVGTLAGAVLAGCVFIPVLGLRGALQVGIMMNLAVAGLLLLRFRPAGTARWAAALAAAALVVAVAAPRWQAQTFAFGAFRSLKQPPTWKQFTATAGAREAKFYKEDFGTTVAVLKDDDPERGTQLRLVVDGKTDASSHGDLPTQTLLAHVPLFLKPEAKDVFILGLGSGVSAGSVLTHPVERVDCAELSEAVRQAAEHFGFVNGHPGRDPRFHLTVDDGKTALAASPRQYDAIISEPTNPWISGVGNLFSEEFFRTAAGKLKPGGLMVQWFHSYEFSDPLAATTIRTFQRVFPHAMLFQGNTPDHILVGSQQPFAVDFAAMEARLRRPEIARDLARVKITRLPALLARQTHTPEAMAQLTEGGGVNSDDLPILEFLAPYALYTGDTAQRIQQTDCRLGPGDGLLLAEYQKRRPLTRDDYQAVLATLADDRMAQQLLEYRLLRAYLERWPGDAASERRIAVALERLGRPEEALAHARRAESAGDAEAAAVRQRLEARRAETDQRAFAIGTGQQQ